MKKPLTRFKVKKLNHQSVIDSLNCIMPDGSRLSDVSWSRDLNGYVITVQFMPNTREGCIVPPPFYKTLTEWPEFLMFEE